MFWCLCVHECVFFWGGVVRVNSQAHLQDARQKTFIQSINSLF